MPWGTIRQHSTGATWENSSKAVNHSRIFGFLPTFKHSLPNTTISGTNHGDARRRTQSMLPPRGVYSQPAVEHTRPRTMQHPPTFPVHSSVRHPRSTNDDPAFSTDPRSHPHFVIVHGDRPRQHSSRPASSSRSQSRQVDESLRREYPISRAESGHSHDRSESLAYLAPPKGQPYPLNSSNNSLFTSESVTTYTSTTSSESYSSSGHSHSSNDYSVPVKQPTSASVPFPVTRSNPSSKHSSRYEEPQPAVRQHSERRSEGHSVSAPDLHQRPSVPTQAPRPMTAPLQDANNRPKPPRRENTRRHNPQRSAELDRIDELDETDPFGVPIHHKGPYEAITAMVNGPTTPSNNDGSAGNGFNYPVQKQRSKKRVEPVISPEGPVFDRSAPLNLVPGQILPRAPIFDLRGLEQTPYQLQHRTHSTPPPPPGIVSPPPRHNERQSPYPRYFPQESDLPPSLRHEPQEWPEVHIDVYEDPYLTSPPPYPPQPPRPPSRSHSRPQSHSHSQPPSQPVPEVRVQTPPDSKPKYQVRPQGPPEPKPQLLSQPESQSLLLRPPSEVELDPKPHSRSQSHFKSHPHLQPLSHSHHNQSQRQPIPQAQSQESESQHQPDRQSQTRYSNRLPSTSSVSSRSSNYGPVPHHVPKHLVMPTPLQPPSNKPQPHESTSSHIRFYDQGPLSTKTNFQPRAKEISMLPEGRKLLRKRTVTHPGNAPIPVRVPLSETPSSSISGKGLFSILGSRAQESTNAPSAMKEKGHRRLSKRRIDV